MRDKRFVAAHRGGPLSAQDHRLLMTWAADCAEHVLSLITDKDIDGSLLEALRVSRAWARGETTVGAAQRASWAAHAVARASLGPVGVMVARSVGQAVATAHMADHSLGAAWYALKAVRSSGGSIESEQRWQNAQLPLELEELVISARNDPKFVLKTR